MKGCFLDLRESVISNEYSDPYIALLLNFAPLVDKSDSSNKLLFHTQIR